MPPLPRPLVAEEEGIKEEALPPLRVVAEEEVPRHQQPPPLLVVVAVKAAVCLAAGEAVAPLPPLRVVAEVVV